MRSRSYLVAWILLLTATALRADEPTAPPKPGEGEYCRPELVAMTWQAWLRTSEASRRPAVWRPDGSLLDADEVHWISKDLSPSSIDWRPSSGQLRPLVLVFRVDERAKSPQSLSGRVRIGNQFQEASSAVYSTKHFLAQTVPRPNSGQLSAWAEEVDVEIRVPIGEPEIVKSFNHLPDGEVKIADGVRWYVDPLRGSRAEDGKTVTGLPAAVFEIEKLADPLATVSCLVRLKNGQILPAWSSKTIDPAGAVTITEVSAPLEESNPIVSGKFQRIRYRLERYEKLPTRLDLKPADPKPIAPVIPGFRAL